MDTDPDADRLRNELAYYKTRVDELAGALLRLDYRISGLRHELKQRKNAFILLTDLQPALVAKPDLPAMLETIVVGVNARLGMDRTLFLERSSDGKTLRPSQVAGFGPSGPDCDALRGWTIECPAELMAENASLLVTRGSAETPLVAEFRRVTELTTFGCVAITGEAGQLGLLLSGRRREAKPLHPPLDEGDIDIFRALAHVVGSTVREMQVERLRRHVDEHAARLRLASRIQLDLLPKQAPVVEGYEIAGRTIPAQEVGGDYFDFVAIDQRRMAVCLGDISGKGLPAAMLMANLQATVRGQALWNPSACDCLARANKLLYRSTDPAKYATMFYGVVNSHSHWLGYSNAGHNPPLLLSANGDVQWLESGGTVLGLFEEATFEEEAVVLAPGSVLVAYSDGITEATSRDEEEFGVERLVSRVRECRTLSAEGLVDAVIDAVNAHAAGMRQADDMTVVVVKR